MSVPFTFVGYRCFPTYLISAQCSLSCCSRNLHTALADRTLGACSSRLRVATSPLLSCAAFSRSSFAHCSLQVCDVPIATLAKQKHYSCVHIVRPPPLYAALPLPLPLLLRVTMRRQPHLPPAHRQGTRTHVHLRGPISIESNCVGQKPTVAQSPAGIVRVHLA